MNFNPLTLPVYVVVRKSSIEFITNGVRQGGCHLLSYFVYSSMNNAINISHNFVISLSNQS